MVRLAWMAAALLLLGTSACSSSNGGGGGGEVRTRCAADTDCALPTPFCGDDGFCVECTQSPDCVDPERPLCLAGVCSGNECSADASCSADAPVCDRGICGACADDADCARLGDFTCDAGACVERPTEPEHALVFIVDRSGSMNTCVEGATAGGSGCTTPAGTTSENGLSRLDLLREGVLERPWMPAGLDTGLIVAGARTNDPACGAPEILVEPGEDNGAAFVAAWAETVLTTAVGGTPTTEAVEMTRALLQGQERSSRVVLVMDGLANCDIDHAMPCTCGNEAGCVASDGSLEVAFLEEGVLLDGRMCNDMSAAESAITALREAGVRTAILMPGAPPSELFAPLATAGGLANPANTHGVWTADTPDGIAAALEAILFAD